jgi:hypothetical protein
MVDSHALQEVSSLELRLLDPAFRQRTDEVDQLLHPDFTEIGASGRRWDRESVLASLRAAPEVAGDVRDLAAREVADRVVLVTYVVDGTRGDVSSLRSSLWVKTDDGWRVLFHQGTLCAPDS